MITRSAYAPAGPAIAETPPVRGVLQRCGGVPCDCDEEPGVLRRSAVTPQSRPAPGVPAAVHDVLRSPGRPLAAVAQSFFGSRFGHDFSHVRVHTGAAASRSAQAVDARAYTVGPHIVFAGGAYAPDTTAGRRLLAHELTHVVQQGRSPAWTPTRISAPSDAPERHADRVAGEILAAPVRDTGPPAAAAVYRQDAGAKPAARAAPERVVPCTAAQKELIKQGLADGAGLADRAAAILGRMAYPGRQEAIQHHFGEIGEGQVNVIRARFERIRGALPTKKVVCLDHCNPSKNHAVDCARGQKGGNLIQVCPEFGGASGLCAVGVTMLHEAAHNDGARGDIDTGPGYPPPKNPEDNPYSYENFALEVAPERSESHLRPHGPEVVPE